MGRRNDVVVRALPLKYGPGSNPTVAAICGLSLLSGFLFTVVFSFLKGKVVHKEQEAHIARA